eukprot:gene3346-biopygen999
MLNRGGRGGAPDPDDGETVVVRRGLSVGVDLTAPVTVHGEHDWQRPRGGRRRGDVAQDAVFWKMPRR